MKTIPIPELNRHVSRLCMGTMVFSRAEQSFTDDMLDAFVAAGGNLLDTAEVYGSERPVGEWIRSRGNRVDIVVLDKALDATEKVTPEAIPKAIAGNLERLGSDYIDLWMLHRDNPQVPAGEIVDVLNAEVRAGRIRAFGGSNWGTDRLQAANDYAKSHGLMGMAGSSPHLSLATAKDAMWRGCIWVTEEDRDWYRRSQMPLFSWSSQARGFFSGRFRPDDTSDANMVRVYYSDENFEKLRRAEELGRRKGVSAIQIALAWVLDQDFPAIALIGPANRDELSSCLEAEKVELTPEELAWLELR